MAYTISTDKALLDISLIHSFLSESYWAKGIPFANVQKRIENALCFGVYTDGKQVGFARVISDFESFAYLADVFIIESHRGQGLSKILMSYIVAYPDLQNLRRFILATADAHGLYAQYDFKPIDNVPRWMEKTDLTVYQRL
jgi:GNAT superfamily N-acetyltransferase